MSSRSFIFALWLLTSSLVSSFVLVPNNKHSFAISCPAEARVSECILKLTPNQAEELEKAADELLEEMKNSNQESKKESIETPVDDTKTSSQYTSSAAGMSNSHKESPPVIWWSTSFKKLLRGN